MKKLLILLMLPLLTSCGTTNVLQQTVESLGKDPATLCIKAVYGPAVITAYRTNATIANAAGVSGKITVKCSNDEMLLEVEPSTGAVIGPLPASVR